MQVITSDKLHGPASLEYALHGFDVDASSSESLCSGADKAGAPCWPLPTLQEPSAPLGRPK